ncbi:delta(1)-pyrroline-2-carboxylate reductase family protein [Oceanithermus sp.]
MKILDATETDKALDYQRLVAELAEVLRQAARGQVAEPLRTVHELAEGGHLLLMPAWDGELGVVKRISVHPGNAARGVPTSQAELLAFDSRTGTGLFVADGNVVTAKRTAALSLLAAKTLHAKPIENVLVIGAGRQARTHVEAFAGELKPKHFFFYNRTLSRASELAKAVREMGVSAQTVPHPERVAAQVDCIISATSSRQPVVPEGVRDDACIIAVGAYTPEMAELPPQLLKKSTVVVDTLSGAKAEAGDLIQAQIDWERVLPLAKALDDPPSGTPMVFKSVGSAIFDLAAARLLARYGT